MVLQKKKRIKRLSGFSWAVISAFICASFAVNGYVKARINGAGFDPLIAAGASSVGLGTRASMHAWF